MRRLSISLVFVVVAAVVGTGWIVGLVYSQLQQQQKNERSNEMQAYQQAGYLLASIIDEAGQEGKALASLEEVLPDLKPAEVGARIIVREELPLPESLQTRFDNGESITLESDGRVTLYFNLSAVGKVLALTPELKGEEQSWSNILLTLLFYAMVIGVLLLWLYPLIQRLKQLDKTALSFGEGNLNSRIDLASSSYIDGIERSFNVMADRIQSLLEDNRLLSRAVSHDLKTPLARLRFGVDALSESRNPERRSYYQERIDQDLEEMESLVSTLLQYAALEDGPPTVENELVDLEQFCLAKCAALGSTAVTCRLEPIAASDKEGCSALTDERYLSMVVGNLMSNAVRHARSEVVIQMSPDDDDIVLTVHDDGAGVPEEQRELIFKPFQRGTPANKHNEQQSDAGEKCHGMGLAIASRIATWLNAALTVEKSSLLGGACFVFRLPKNLQEEPLRRASKLVT